MARRKPLIERAISSNTATMAFESFATYAIPGELAQLWRRARPLASMGSLETLKPTV